MPVLQDLTGNKYRMLTVLRRADKIGKRIAWHCLCDCGEECVVASCNLKGRQVSCGCYNRESASKRAGEIFTKHGMHGTPIYNRWRAMMKRCSKSASHCRHNYYDRGITVCDEWKNDPAAFMRWARANGFREDLELDRIDNEAGYSPDNCRFATRKEQAANRRTHGVTPNKNY